MNQKLLISQDYIFSTGIIVDDKIYFFTELENVFMQIDMKTWKIKYLDKFLEYNLYFGRADKLQTINNKIYKLSLDGRYVEEFSLKDERYKKIEIGIYDKPWRNFVAFEYWNQYLFIFPKGERQVIRINTDDYRVERIKLCNKEESTTKKFLGYSVSYRCKNEIWLFETINNWIHIYNMESNMVRLRAFPDGIGECLNVCEFRNYFYFLTLDNQIYSWNIENNSLILLWDGEKYYGIKYYFGEILCTQQKLLLMPALGEDIVVLDYEKGNSTIMNKYPENFYYFNIKWAKYINYFCDTEYIYYPMRSSDYLALINRCSGEIEWKKLVPPSKKDKKLNMQIKCQRQYLTIPDDVEFVDSLLYLTRNVMNKSIFGTNRGSIGSEIWNHMKILYRE